MLPHKQHLKNCEHMCILALWKESWNSDGQQFHQYQQNNNLSRLLIENKIDQKIWYCKYLYTSCLETGTKIWQSYHCCLTNPSEVWTSQF